TDEQKRAYQYSTDNTAGEVAEFSGAGRSTVAAWWKKWHRAGLGELRPARGGSRFVRNFDLEDFDISVPPLKERAERVSVEQRNDAESEEE
ncbi:MAG: helix-turn-helix domain-containing protein, partial [bacterium]